MTSPLEKLRAIARGTPLATDERVNSFNSFLSSPSCTIRQQGNQPHSSYERNERNEISRPDRSPERLLSFNSFLSSPENTPKRAGVGEQDERFCTPTHADDRAERANTAENEPGIRDERFAALSGRHRSSTDSTCSPRQLLSSTRNTPRPPYERNERNEISPSEPPPGGTSFV